MELIDNVVDSPYTVIQTGELIMADTTLTDIVLGMKEGQIVPYLGAGALKGAVNTETGEPIPADSDSLIIAMNNGKPMAPKLMYEFPRAAMNIELKRGRSAVNRFLEELYSKKSWTTTPLHEALSGMNLPYIIDINRDTTLQDSYSDMPHNLILGCARLGASQYRFRIFEYDGSAYNEIEQENVKPELPLLFKPMGSPVPDPTFIASDADYVDYITELMGGFAIPDFLKKYRMGKQYVFLGLRLNRDTERMVMSDIIYGADKPAAWALIPEPNKKEERFCKRMNIEIIRADVDDFVNALLPLQTASDKPSSHAAQ